MSMTATCVTVCATHPRDGCACFNRICNRNASCESRRREGRSEQPLGAIPRTHQRHVHTLRLTDCKWSLLERTRQNEETKTQTCNVEGARAKCTNKATHITSLVEGDEGWGVDWRDGGVSQNADITTGVCRREGKEGEELARILPHTTHEHPITAYTGRVLRGDKGTKAPRV